MKKKISFNTALALLLVALAIFNGVISITTYRQGSELNKLVSELEIPAPMEAENFIDTSAIDGWCAEYPDGKIRMIGAWVYGKTSGGENILQDESGEMWIVDYTTSEENFYLLWIADNHTPGMTTDDIVIQVWSQVYE